ncbi:MAG: pyridoxal-phosphate dependent enzyme, partial [Magnetovibrio sp.]|nr:pyridoxal-phosphate dependent enzyme [Magnetovibrio sp.]
KLGLKAVIVVPECNSADMNQAIEALGAELIVHGEDFQESLEFTRNLAEERSLFMIGPFEKPLIRGVATYALEFFEQAGNLDAVYVPIGMGSGICGLISVRDALGLKTEIIGVVAQGAPAYALSFAKGEVVSTNSADTIAGGVACRVPSPEAFEIIKNGAARVITVSDDEILDAIGYYFIDTHNMCEGAAATPLAGLMKEKDQMAGKKVGLILSGGNVDRDTLAQALERMGPQ